MSLLSICIPAYKRTEYLKRLLDSIAIQSFKDFEVIVTDDSSGNEVNQLALLYSDTIAIKYIKNKEVLGTPENWNEAIRNAKGQWIKLIHDDDWFSSRETLQKFADAVKTHPDCSFFFSAYTNVYEDSGRRQPTFLKALWKNSLLKNPNILIADNVVGPPSVTLHRNDKKIWYDPSMKYVVDIDFYIRYLRNGKPCYIGESLIDVGINKAQVTKYTFNVPEVHLKESLYLLQKTGASNLRNIIVFDGWWRLVRNFRLRKIEDIRSTGYDGIVPPILLGIMKFQQEIPEAVLKNGLLSKLLMSTCFTLNVGSIHD
jgi:glycosyltransferase involved in cell wall biosynthesis